MWPFKAKLPERAVKQIAEPAPQITDVLTKSDCVVGFTARMCFTEDVFTHPMRNDPLPASIERVWPDGRIEVKWHHATKSGWSNPSAVVYPSDILVVR